LNAQSKSKAKKVDTSLGIVVDDLPEHIPVTAQEVTLLRAFLAREINESFWPTASSARPSEATPPADNQPADHCPAAVANDGASLTGAQLCR
jgi:hypothetical protein